MYLAKVIHCWLLAVCIVCFADSILNRLNIGQKEISNLFHLLQINPSADLQVRLKIHLVSKLGA